MNILGSFLKMNFGNFFPIYLYSKYMVQFFVSITSIFFPHALWKN